MESPDTRSVQSLTQFEWTADEEPVFAITMAVSDLLDSDPCELEPLYESVDAELLDRFLTVPFRTTVLGTIQFEYLDHWIELRTNGTGEIFESRPASHF